MVLGKIKYFHLINYIGLVCSIFCSKQKSKHGVFTSDLSTQKDAASKACVNTLQHTLCKTF